MTEFTNTPMMADQEIGIMDSLFTKFRPQVCLEWGAGGSTIYWPQKHEFIRTWVSVEANKEWYDYLKPRVDMKVDLRLVDFRDYYTSIYHEGVRYDFILVDGVYRTCCLVVAAQIIKPSGYVVLHDAGRSDYDNAIRIFKKSEVLYEGELPRGDQPPDAYRKGYLHRGLRVFYP